MEEQQKISKKIETLLVVGGLTAFTLYVIYRLRVVWYAKKWEKVTEVGSDQGFVNQTFQKMMADVGWVSGHQWCAYFVKAVWLKVYGDNPVIRSILQSNVYPTWRNAKADTTGTVKVLDQPGDKPKPGDIVIWWAPNGGGHTGIVVSATSKKYGKDGFTTIEGNTNEQGVQSGQGVYVMDRKYTWDNPAWTLKGFIRKTIIPQNVTNFLESLK